MRRRDVPPLGLSVRQPWLAALDVSTVQHVEIVADNWMWATDDELAPLDALRRDVPIFLHALGLNIGSTDGLDPEYVDRLKALADRLEAAAVSDHFAWRSVDGHWSTAFLPIALEPSVLPHVAARVSAVQDRLGRPLALETPSEYVARPELGLDLADALLLLHEACGCQVVVDACNLRVSAHNVGGDPWRLAARLAPAAAYTHVAGFRKEGRLWLDEHGSAPDAETLAIAGAVGAPVVIEWDRNLPRADDLPTVLRDARRGLRGGDRTLRRPRLDRPEPAASPPAFPGLLEWNRAFMDRARQGARGYEALFADQVYGALNLLEEAYPRTRVALGLNFRCFVREMTKARPPTDVHGRSLLRLFPEWLTDHPILAGEPEIRQTVVEEAQQYV